MNLNNVIEAQCLNYILNKKSWSLVIYNNLDESYFSTYSQEYRFIKDHYEKYNTIPDKETIIGEFPDFEFIEVNESESYLVKELRELHLYRSLVPDVNKIVDLMSSGKSDEAFNVLVKASSKVNLKPVLEPVDLIKQADIRANEYKQKCEDQLKAYVTTGLPELDEIIGGWDRQEEFAIVAAKTNQGKCLEKGTKVLMADGSLKKVEDIIIGDKVQSINSINTVFELHSGKAKGYKLKLNETEYFTISSDHILTLAYVFDKTRLIDISIEDYLAMPNYFKDSYMLYKPKEDKLFYFSIEVIEEIQYYGFACDGDHRFILGNGIITHNSWWILYFALHAAIKGLKVGIYSGEMEPSKVGYRLDTFLSHISNYSMTHGDKNIQSQYEDYINTLSSQVKNSILVATPEMLDGNATVGKLRAFIERNELDMLIIDQLSLMDDEKRAKVNHEAYANIVKDLKSLQTMKHIPIIAAAQLNREQNETGISIENIAGSYDIMRYATTGILLEQKDKDDQRIKRLVITIGKARDARVGSKLTYMWDINYGKLTYVPTENDATEGKHIEELKDTFGDMEENVF